jgi:tetratricopeptide (TPR) repeat protein
MMAGNPGPEGQRQVLLSLAMIVKDGGSDLVRCLASASSCVDEIVVVDTGSSDSSPEVAAQAGARVLSRNWQDDFAAARNISLDACRGRWILVLDADEAIAPQDGVQIRRWVEAQDRAGELSGAVITTRNYQPLTTGMRGWTAVPSADHHALPEGPPAPGYVPTRKVRIFPNHPAVRFTGCLHEIVDANLLRAGGKLVDLEIPIHHFGLLRTTPAKILHYLALARRKVEHDPRNAQAWSELADCYQNAGQLGQALTALDRALKLQAANPAYRLKAGLLLFALEKWQEAEPHLTAVVNAPEVTDEQLAESLHARALIRLRQNQPAEAAPDLALALKLDPAQGLFWNSLGVWYLLNKRGEQARAALERAQAMLPGHPDPLLNLGILYEAAGRQDQATAYFRQALAVDGECAEARRRLERRRAKRPAEI